MCHYGMGLSEALNSVSLFSACTTFASAFAAFLSLLRTIFPASAQGRCSLLDFNIFLEVTVIVLVRTDHDQFEVFIDKSVGQQILDGFYLEFMNIDTAQVALLFSSYQRIFNNMFWDSLYKKTG